MTTSPAVVFEIERYGRIDKTLRLLAANTGESLADTLVGELVEAEPDRLEAEPYPPELPGQRYVRTFTLAASWEQEQVGTGEWEIINTATQKGRQYAEYVVGEPEDQADVHRGRWWTGREKVVEHFERYGPEAVQDALARRYEREMARGF